MSPLFLPQVPLLPTVIHVSVVTFGFLLLLGINQHNAFGIRHRLISAEPARKTELGKNGFHSCFHMGLDQCIESM